MSTNPDMMLLYESALVAAAVRDMYKRIKSHQDARFFTYVLLLQQGKIYVGSTDNIYSRLADHFSCSPSSALWVREYGPPIRVIEVIKNCCAEDEQYKFTEYADKFGFENVRGGGCCRLVISNEPPSVKNFQRRRDDFEYMSRAEIDDIMHKVKNIIL